MKKRTIWDPLRKKEVVLTPEEDVRQWFIKQLSDLMKVPGHMMMSEVNISTGVKKYRAEEPPVRHQPGVLPQQDKKNGAGSAAA